jgi:CRISPR-associated protein Cmr3
VTDYRLIQPVDVLFLRGNRLFGQPGDHAEALVPPWPSVFSGALRTRMMVDHGIPFDALLGSGTPTHALAEVLGTVDAPGTFRLSLLAMAGNSGTPGVAVEPLLPAPADVVVTGEDVRLVKPVDPSNTGAILAAGTGHLAVLRASSAGKAEGGVWITAAGLAAYVQDRVPDRSTLVDPKKDLWDTETRLGIAVDSRTRTAEEGKLYTSEVVTLRSGVAFLVGVNGAGRHLPDAGLLRLGGDGRGASIAPWRPGPVLPWAHVLTGPRFRIVTLTPCISPDGSMLCGLRKEGDVWRLRFRGLVARLLAASVGRPQVVSGWDLARGQPKTAERAIPGGSVFWFEREGGDPAVLRALIDGGIWPLLEDRRQPLGSDLLQRRAEGFGKVLLADGPAGEN